MGPETQLFRNPGPTWSYALLTQMQRWLPRWLAAIPFKLGTMGAVVVLPVQRRHSRAFLTEALGRPARLHDVWRHFDEYLRFLLLRLRLARGRAPECTLDPQNAPDFEALMNSGEPALFGTFHFGHSDLLGFVLARRGRRVAMIRLRVANSGDTVLLEEQFRDSVSFIWVNDPNNLLFAMKDAIERGDSLAMQCDRLFSSRTETFDFFGARRVFPFAIYHLAVLFQRPVMICIGMPFGRNGTRVYPSSLFRPDPARLKAENLAAARDHFQGVLVKLEALVRQAPYLWFNFLPLNPIAPGNGNVPPTPAVDRVPAQA